MTFPVIAYYCRARRQLESRANLGRQRGARRARTKGTAMFRRKPVTALTVGLTLLAACANTTLTSTWRAPDVQRVSFVGKSIGVVFITDAESMRRTGENALARELSARGARGFATFLMLPGDQHLDAEVAQARLKTAGADAAVFMRVVGQEQRITYSPPYRGFGPYWGMGWRTMYQPGTVRTDTLVSVETLVYSLPDARTSQLLWASTSRTTNPAGLDGLVRDVAAATARAMANEGFLAR